MTDYKLGVHSETGILRQVIVCRPGLAHRRLTPSNCDALLFDDVFWVKQAQKDHDVFVELMRARAVEVLDVNELLAETLDIDEARAWILDHRITWNHVGVGMVSELRAWMDELPGQRLAEFLIGGLQVNDLPFNPSGLFGNHLGPFGFILPPLPNFPTAWRQARRSAASTPRACPATCPPSLFRHHGDYPVSASRSCLPLRSRSNGSASARDGRSERIRARRQPATEAPE